MGEILKEDELLSEENYFIDMEFLWPSKNLDIRQIENEKQKTIINWSHNYFEDYKQLAFQFYKCGYEIFKNIMENRLNTKKMDTIFLAGIFLIRQSIELDLKALVIRTCDNNRKIQENLKNIKHDLSLAFQVYCNAENDEYLTEREKLWIDKYLQSLVMIDRSSDTFRFPFEEKFLINYKNKFIDIESVIKSLLQAKFLIDKCIDRNTIDNEFNSNLSTDFFSISHDDSFYDCYLWQPDISNKEKNTEEFYLRDIFLNGCYTKIEGYTDAIDIIYDSQNISKETKFYPLMFMFRNTIELCLKQLLCSFINYGITWKDFKKRRSHLIKKDLWNKLKPVLLDKLVLEDDKEDILIVDKMIEKINSIDSKGDLFRYPTRYSLEYSFDKEVIDLENIYVYCKSLVNYLDSLEYSFENTL